MLTCQFCRFGAKFTPRADELARFGDDVMGCIRPGWEGYTQKTANCEAFQMLSACHDYRHKAN